MQREHTVRLAGLMLVFAGNALLCHRSVSPSYVDVMAGIRCTCMVVICASAYLCVGSWCARRGAGCAPGCFARAPPARVPEIPLSMRNVLLYVYGTGTWLFVCTYCCMGTNLAPVFWYMIGMAGVAVDDAMVRRREPVRSRCLTAFTLLCTTLAGLLLLLLSPHSTFSFREAVDRGDWFVIAAGVVFPVTTPFVTYAIRSPARTSQHAVMQYMQYGTPYALILAATIWATTAPPHSAGWPHTGAPRLADRAYEAPPHRRLLADDDPLAAPNVTELALTAPNVTKLALTSPNVTELALSLAMLTSSPPLPGLTTPLAHHAPHPASLTTPIAHHAPHPASPTPPPEPEPPTHTRTYALIFLVPITLLPMLYLTFCATMDYLVIDVICVMMTVVTGRHVLLVPGSVVAGPAFLVAVLAMAARIATLSLEADTGAPLSPYQSAAESAALMG